MPPVTPQPGPQDAVVDISFRDVVDSTALGVTVHLDGAVVYANRAAEALLGRAEGELVGVPSMELAGPVDVARLQDAVRALEAGTTVASYLEIELVRPDGMRIVVESVLERVAVGGRTAVGVFSCDVTERVQREEELAHAATHDALTDLPNRSLLLDRVEQSFSRLGRQNEAVLLVFCDVDGFKEVNDTHGHQAGDEVLRQVARRLQLVLRAGDTVARLAGDEFVVCVELQEERTAGAVQARLEAATAPPVRVGDAELAVGLSMGAVVLREPVDPLLALAEADRLMYEQKTARRQEGRP